MGNLKETFFHVQYKFGNNGQKAEIYTPVRGYGFVTEKCKREQEQLKYPELNAGFELPYWYQEENLSIIECDREGCYIDGQKVIADLEEKGGEKIQGEHRRIPLSFKIDVPKQGNYKVTVVIQAAQPIEEILIFTGRRRLAYKGKIAAGCTLRQEMTVNVCDIIPRGKEEVYIDRSLDVTIVADKPRITEIQAEELECPTIYIAGDSTVTDQSGEYPYAPGTCYCGWGQMLTAFLDGKTAVSNHAHSGLTTETFRSEGHYEIIEKYIKKGDFFFLQFGHNDQKHQHLQAQTGYKKNLIRYVQEVRQKGAFPILVTPLARNTWKGTDGTYLDLLKEHAEVCVAVGREYGVPILDLHKKSMKFIQGLGMERAKVYFYPNDYTHTNDYGGYRMAQFVAEEIQKVCGTDTKTYYGFLGSAICGGFGEWRPQEQIVSLKKPRLYENIVNPCPTEELLGDVSRLEEPADRAAVLDMIIRTARFVPVNVYNDMYEDVGGHEWYAGAVESAYQNGIIPEEFTEEKCLHPDKAVTLEEFLVFAMNAYRSKKEIAEEICIYDDKCHPFARPCIRTAFAAGLLPKDGSGKLNAVINRGEAVELCRKMQL